jgi:hypothetical protein
MQQDGSYVSFMGALCTVSVHNTCNFSIKKKNNFGTLQYKMFQSLKLVCIKRNRYETDFIVFPKHEQVEHYYRTVFNNSTSTTSGAGSSVGVATDYGLNGPGIESRWGEIFRPFRPALGLTQPPVQWVPGLSRV